MSSSSTASLNWTQDGDTPLMRASREGHVTVVRLLLENRADVNICDKVVMDFVSCTCMWTFSQLAVCYIRIRASARQRDCGIPAIFAHIPHTLLV